MPNNIIEAVYPWDTTKRAQYKKNTAVGNFISLFSLYLFFTIYIFLISKFAYHPLLNLERKSFGTEGTILSILGIFTNNFGLGLLLFIAALLISFAFVLITLNYKIKQLRNLFSYLHVDLHGHSLKENVFRIIRDLMAIELYSILSFIIILIFLSALASITLAIIVPMLIQKGVKMFTYIYTILAVEQILIYPLFVYGYYYFVRKRMSEGVKISLSQFYNEEGEIDYNLWKNLTWGKKSYSYNWEKEEYYPIICPSCGSVISSNLTVCPICNADLIEEISSLEEESENEIKEKDNEKDDKEKKGTKEG